MTLGQWKFTWASNFSTLLALRASIAFSRVANTAGNNTRTTYANIGTTCGKQEPRLSMLDPHGGILGTTGENAGTTGENTGRTDGNVRTTGEKTAVAGGNAETTVESS